MVEPQGPQLQKIKKNIAFQQMALKTRENDANAQNLMGKHLSELAKLTNSPSDYQAALPHLNKAIQLDPQNVGYLCDRATLHGYFKNTEAAVIDFQALNYLRERQTSNSAWTNFQLVSTLKDLAKLKEIQNTIRSLRSRGALPADFLDAFESLRCIAEGLVVTVGDHSAQLQKIWDNLRKLEEKAENISPQDMPAIFKILEEFNIRLTDQEKKILTQGKQIEEHKEILEVSGVKDLADLKKELKKLETMDPQLYTYATTVYWAALNLFGAYRHLSTGLVAGGSDLGVGGAVANDAVKKVASAATSFLKSVPLVGGLFEFTDTLIDSLFEWLDGKKLEEKCSVVSKIIKKFCLTDDELSLLTGKISLVLANCPGKSAVLRQSVQQASQQKKGWFTTRCEKIQKKMWPGAENETAVVEAIKDVTLLFSYLLVNYETVLASPEALQDQIKGVLKSNKFDKMVAGIGVNGACKKCQKLGLAPRSGKKPGSCFTCKKVGSGGLKCSSASCGAKYCKTCV